MSSRDVLPIPDRQHVGLTTYDAKDPDTSYPPIEPLLPPAGAPNVLVVLLDDAGFGSSSAFGGPCQTPTFERLAANGPALQPLPHHGAVLADAPGAAHRAQPPRRRHGRDHRDRDIGAGLQLAAPQHGGAAGRDPEAQRLLDRPVRQVPRGAGVADEPDGAVRELAVRRRRLRALLRLPRRGDEPVRPGDLQRHRPGGARPHAGGGLPLHRGHDRSRDRLGPPAEGADARQAVLRLLRARRDPRAPPRADRVVGQVQGPVRRRLGRAARGDARAPEGARGGPRGRRAHGAPRRDPGVGGHARRPQARPRAPDGGLRRLHGAHRPPRRPAHRRPRRPRDPRRHARVRDGGRQRRLRRGHAQRLLQRADVVLNGAAAHRDGRVHGLAHRRLRHAQGLQPLRGRLGPRDGHALPVDQADRLALGRHPQRDDRPLAGRHQGQGRGPHAVPPRHRHRRHGARRGRAPGAHVRPRRAADAAARRVDGLLVRRRGGRRAARDAVLRDVLQPRHLPQGLDRGHPPQHAVGDGAEPAARPGRVGALRAPTTGRSRTTSQPSSPRSWPSCSACSSSRRRSTTSCPSTTAASSASTPTSPGARSSCAATASCCSAAWDG